MSRPITTIHNVETGEIETREMNELEFADYQALQTELADEAMAKAQAATDKAALLARLGITEEEAALLLGGTN
jgi:predicted metal-binding transcription factor (methanogenesis marker protein 9)